MGLLSGIGDVLGGGISSAVNYDMWKQQKKWLQKMSATAHQREVADLKKAGLNPILSSGGHGASVGGLSAGGIHDLGGNFSRGIASALAVKNTKADLALKGTALTSEQIDVQQKQRVYDWLAKNPQFEDLYYAGRLSKEAGLNASVYGPLLGVNSAKTKGRVERAVDWIGEKLGYGRPYEKELRPATSRESVPIPQSEIRRKFGGLKPQSGERR